jgi:hypothetical protein
MKIGFNRRFLFNCLPKAVPIVPLKSPRGE